MIVVQIMIYDKALARRGTLGNPASVEVDIVANGVGSATIKVADSAPRLQDALADGARCVITEPGVFTLSGPITGATGTGPRDASVTLTVTEDTRVFADWMGWPAPGKPIATQGAAYAKYTGNAETIVKAVLNANRGRYPDPVTVAPNANRGAVVPGGVAFRWHPLTDRLLPAIEQAGIVLTAMQSGSTIVLDVRARRIIARPLSAESGNLASWSWTSAAPTATRVVAGGQGEGAARTAKQSIATAREAALGYAIEKFVDARDTDEPEELAGRMSEAIDDGAPKSGLSLDLVPSKGFQYGTHYQVGDIITVKAGGMVKTDILRSIHASWTAEAGFVLTPQVGDASDDPDTALAKSIRALSKGQKNLEVQK